MSLLYISHPGITMLHRQEMGQDGLWRLGSKSELGKLGFEKVFFGQGPRVSKLLKGKLPCHNCLVRQAVLSGLSSGAVGWGPLQKPQPLSCCFLEGRDGWSLAPGLLLLSFRTQATPPSNASPLSLKTKTFSIREECAFEGTACLPGDLQLVEQLTNERSVPCVFLVCHLPAVLPTQSFPIQNDKD